MGEFRRRPESRRRQLVDMLDDLRHRYPRLIPHEGKIRTLVSSTPDSTHRLIARACLKTLDEGSPLQGPRDRQAHFPAGEIPSAPELSAGMARPHHRADGGVDSDPKGQGAATCLCRRRHAGHLPSSTAAGTCSLGSDCGAGGFTAGDDAAPDEIRG